MITRSLHEANWSYLSKRRFEAILADNDRQNDKRIVHFYKPGDHVMLRTPKAFRPKTAAVATGPFTIKTVHDNGTVTLDKALSYYFFLRRLCIDTAPRNLQVYAALRSPTVREARNALDRRIALAVRAASAGARTCAVCGFANATRANVASCALCGAALARSSATQRLAQIFGNRSTLLRTDDALPFESSRQRRVRRRRACTRGVDIQGAIVWHASEPSHEVPSTGEPFYVLHASREQSERSVKSVVAPPQATEQPEGEGATETNSPISITVGAAEAAEAALSSGDVARELEAAWSETTVRVVRIEESDPTRVAYASSTIDAPTTTNAQLHFPTKLVNFMTSVASLLSEASASDTPSVAHVQIARGDLWTDSVEAIATMPATQARFPIRVAFVGEPGIDAGALYREWVGLLNKTLVTPDAGIFTCVDAHEQTFYLNRHSRDVLGESHLAHCLVAGRLIGSGLLDGNATGFQLAPPLLKIILGLPVSFEDLEYYDAEAFKSLQWLVTNNGVDALGLDFTVVEKLPDGTTKVVELVPGGSDMDVTDANKLEYIDRKLQYLLFESVERQLFAFLTGLYDVVPAELLTAFDAEELGLLLSGSDEIDVDDWEANTLAFVDDGRGNSGKPLMLLPCHENFWKVVRALSNDERRRLLHFATGSTRPPPGGFSSLTSYDGRLALFTLRGVEESATHGYLQSHACFNRLDLPTFWTLKNMRRAVHCHPGGWLHDRMNCG